MTESASVIEIKSLKALQQWLIEECPKSPHWFGCQAPGRSKCLLVSSSPTYEVQYDAYTTVEHPLFPLDLPAASNARDWWRALWEGDISVCLYSEHSRMLVITKLAVWDALPGWYLLMRKSDFVELEWDFVRQVVGVDLCDTMLSECDFVGIAARRLDYEIASVVEKQLNPLTNRTATVTHSSIL